MSATYAPATVTERRVSLSRGPALIIGTILLAAGLYFTYRQHTYPAWGNFPNGGAPVDRHVWGLFGINGFTGLFTAVAGGLLLFGAAGHFLSKTMSLIVGVALGAAAIIALISGNVLGLVAANGWTELAWGIAAAILLVNALMPAYRRTIRTTAATAGAAVVADRTVPRREPAEQPVARDELANETVARGEREPVTYRRPITGAAGGRDLDDREPDESAGAPARVGGSGDPAADDPDVV